MPIEDLAREEVVSTDRDTNAPEVAATMRDEGVGSVVVTDDRTPVGIVTDRDLAVRLVADGTDPVGVTAGDVMSGDLCAVGPDTGFYEVAETMSEHGVRRLPVCEDDELVGIITADDLIELLSDEHEQLAEIIRAQRPAY
jgi:CBS domain-containing protein